MNKEQIIQLIKSTTSDFTNQSIPWHTHNLVDSPAINSFDINTSNSQGFVFGTNTKDFANFFFDPITSSLSIQENADISSINFEISAFKNVIIFADGPDSGDSTLIGFLGPFNNTIATNYSDANILTKVEDGIDTLTEEIITTGIIYTTTNLFSIQLPISNIPTPVAGGIYYDGTNFYACADGITWQIISLI